MRFQTLAPHATHRRPGFPVRKTLAIAALILLAAPLPAEPAINRSYFGRVAIHGYDPVAYFTQGRPVAGTADISYEYDGAVWRFASAEHRRLFVASPTKYIPQYGGYCAYAVAHGYTADITPTAWKIINGRLYLNYDAEVQSMWEKERDAFIDRANKNWPGVLK